MSREPLPQDGSDAPQVELERSFWTHREKFPVPVEEAFQLEMDRMREHRMVRTGIAAVLLYSAFGLADRVMLPDAYQQAWAIRFLMVVPFLLFCTFYVYRLKKALWREALLSLSLLVSGISLPVIAGLSSHPNATHYQTGITLIVLFGNIVLRQRFRGAVATSVMMVLIYGLTLSHIDTLPAAVRFNNWLFCLSAVVISLIANFRMDQDQRRAYLARMREQERNTELSHAVELLEKLSSEDGLTQVANRREFERRLAIEWSRARRDGLPLAVIMVDIDCFKNFNDHYGHPAGDACLQQVAAALRRIPQRAADLVARYGGEEFVALLPATDADHAAKVAEHMRQAIVDLQIPHATSRVASGVTGSFGVASMLPTGHAQAATLVAAADAALYKAKQSGRNRVAVHAAEEVLARAAGTVH
ncbi:MAG TPA: diguanylate cyclase [Noviherbaspirillum sp.]